LLEKENKQHFF